MHSDKTAANSGDYIEATRDHVVMLSRFQQPDKLTMLPAAHVSTGLRSVWAGSKKGRQAREVCGRHGISPIASRVKPNVSGAASNASANWSRGPCTIRVCAARSSRTSTRSASADRS